MERRNGRSLYIEGPEPPAAWPASPSVGSPRGLLLTVEQVALLWFGEVGDGGSASSNCQKIRRLIPQQLPARRIGNRWYVNRAAAEAWVNETDAASVMAHPSNRQFLTASRSIDRGGSR